ncbi:11045_t:CDS:2, partial [Funneliformis geosporum]
KINMKSKLQFEQQPKNENYPEKERKDKTVLNVSKQELKGTLRLKGFTSLKRINCSNNRLTNLDLSDCPNLIELDGSNNEFTNLNFLKPTDKLEQLNISNCPVKGSLKPLTNLKNLETLFITNTNLNEGLEYLSTSCKKLVCNSNPPTKIMEELNQSKCSREDSYNKKYYNLDK